MSESRPSLSELIDKYLQGTLSPIEATWLRMLMESEKETDIHVTSSILSHLILSEYARSRTETKESPQQCRDRFESLLPPDMLDTESVSETNAASLLLTRNDIFNFDFPENHDPCINTIIFNPEPAEINTDTSFFHAGQKKRTRLFTHVNLWNMLLNRKMFTNIGVAILLLVTAYYIVQMAYHRFKKTDDLFHPIARITEMIDPVWANDNETFERGQFIASERIHLKSGLIKLEYLSGAQLVLEGPAEIFTKSEMSVWCVQGKISAHIPPEAVGFEIGTRYANFIDRGTDFHLDVGMESAKLSVIQGKVDVGGDRGILSSLTTGRAVSVDPAQSVTPVASENDQYYDNEKFNRSLSEYVVRQEGNNRERIRVVDRTPDLIARYAAFAMEGQRIPNASPGGTSRCSELDLTYCSFGEGRYQGSQAFAIGNRDQYASMTMSGRYRKLTIFISVRIDDLRNQANVLLASDEFMRSKGGFLWQISHEGELVFFLSSETDGKTMAFRSQKCFKPSGFGIWYHLALTVDHHTKQIKQYVNGREVGSAIWANPQDIIFKQCYLGNVVNPKLRITDRFFQGAIDELFIYDRTLSQREIINLGKKAQAPKQVTP